MKRNATRILISVVLFSLAVCAVFAAYTGPNPELRDYSVDTTQNHSSTGVYVQCLRTTGCSPTCNLGQYCNAAIPDGVNVSDATSCAGFTGTESESTTANKCTINYTTGEITNYRASNATATHVITCNNAAGFGPGNWCNTSVVLTISGEEPKPGEANFIQGAELSDGQKSCCAKQPNYSFTYDLEGDQIIKYWTLSTVGDTSEAMDAAVRIDKTMPVASCAITSTPAYLTNWYTGAVTVKGTSSDILSKIYRDHLNLGLGAGEQIDTATAPATYSGPVKVNLFTEDNALNTTANAVCAEFNMDNTKPVIVSATDPGTDWLPKNLTFSIKASDAHSGVNSVSIIIDDVEKSFNGTEYSVTQDYTTGEHRVSYKVVDNVGLVTTQGPYEFKVDGDAPTVSITTPVMNGVSGLINYGLTVAGTASDKGSGIQSIEINFPGTNVWVPVTFSTTQVDEFNQTATWSIVIPASPAMTEGAGVMAVRASDKCSNTSDPADTENVTVDTIKPEPAFKVTSGTLGLEGWYRGAITVTAASTDSGSGVIAQTVDLGLGAGGIQNAATIPATYTGKLTITVWAKDYANNAQSKSFPEAVWVDNAKPTASQYCDIDSTKYTSGTLTACIEDGADVGSGILRAIVTVDGSQKFTTDVNRASGTINIAVNMPSGNHSLVYTLEDYAGNVSEPSQAFKFKIDNEAPTITFTSAPTVYYPSTTEMVYQGVVTDEVSGLKEVLVSFDKGSTWEDLTVDTNGAFSVTFNPNKTQKIMVKAVDNAGNVSTLSNPDLSFINGRVRLTVPNSIIKGMTVVPGMLNDAGEVISDFSLVQSARAFVYGRGYDHTEVKLDPKNGYAFTWDGKFPGVDNAPTGWYYITIETTDIAGGINCFTTRVWVGEVKQVEQPVAAPAYSVVDVSGLAGNITGKSLYINGIEYRLADFSKVAKDVTDGSNVIGKARFYTKEKILAVESLTKVQEETATFNGLIDDLGKDYVIVDGHTMTTTENTQWYCEDTRVGDYVSGVVIKDSTDGMTVKEIGPLSCDRDLNTRIGSGVVSDNPDNSDNTENSDN